MEQATIPRRPPAPTPRARAWPQHIAGGLLTRLRDLGGMLVLALQVVVVICTPPYSWVRPFLIECISVMRLAIWPMIFAIVVFCFGGPGVQSGSFFTEVGSPDRQPAGYIIGSIRDLAVFTVATYMAGIYGTQTTAELGARRITGEIDALESLGVDPLRVLTAPRVLAMTVMLSLFTILIIVVGTVGGYVAGSLLYVLSPAAFFDGLLIALRPVDILQGFARGALIGFPMGVVFCYQGLKVKGGPAGVGLAVNRAIVGGIIVIFSVSVAFSLLIQAFYPELSSPR